MLALPARRTDGDAAQLDRVARAPRNAPARKLRRTLRGAATYVHRPVKPFWTWPAWPLAQPDDREPGAVEPQL